MELERAVGKLEGRLDGIEETNKHFNTRFDRIEGKLDTLLADKWKRVGAASVIAAIMSVGVSLFVELVRANAEPPRQFQKLVADPVKGR